MARLIGRNATATYIFVLPSLVLALLKTRSEVSLKDEFCYTQNNLMHQSCNLLYMETAMEVSLPFGIGAYVNEEIEDMVYEKEAVEDLLKFKALEIFSKYLIQTDPSTKSLSRSEWTNLFSGCEATWELHYGVIATEPEFVDNYHNFAYEDITQLKRFQLYRFVGALKRGVSCEAINKFLNTWSFDYFDFADHPIWNGVVGKALLKHWGTFDIIQIAKYEGSIEKIIEKEGPLSKKSCLAFAFPEYASKISNMKYSRKNPSLIRSSDYKELFSKLSPSRRKMAESVGWGEIQEYLTLAQDPNKRPFFYRYYDGWRENRRFDLSINRIMNSSPTLDLKRSHGEYLKGIALEEPQGAIYGVFQETVKFVGPINYSSPAVDSVFEEHLWKFLHPFNGPGSVHQDLANGELWYLYRKMLKYINSAVEDKVTFSRVLFSNCGLPIFLGDKISIMPLTRRTLIFEKIDVHLSKMFKINTAKHYEPNHSADASLETCLNQFLSRCDVALTYRRVVKLLKRPFDFVTRAFLITCHARLIVRYPGFKLPLYARPLFDDPLTRSMKVLTTEGLFTDWSVNIEDALNNMNLVYKEYDPESFFTEVLKVRDSKIQELKKLTGNYEVDVRKVISRFGKNLPIYYIYKGRDFLW